MTKLKVYGWLEWVQACPPAENGNHQARVVIATTSWSDAAHLARSPLNYIMAYGDTTENAAEVEVAMAYPGIAWWSSDTQPQHSRDWRILHPDQHPGPAWAAMIAYRTLPTSLTESLTTELEHGREALAALGDKNEYRPTHRCIRCGKTSMFEGEINEAVQHCKWCQRDGTLRRIAPLEYIIVSHAYYSTEAMFQLRKDSIVEEVQFGLGIGLGNDGQSWCASFTWHRMGDRQPDACRMAAYDDAWAGLRESGALEILDRHPGASPTVTVDDICGALDNLGFIDVTPIGPPSMIRK